jgi:hypothetical protein
MVFVNVAAGALPICALSVGPGTWFGFQFVTANQFVEVTTVFVQRMFAPKAGEPNKKQTAKRIAPLPYNKAAAQRRHWRFGKEVIGDLVSKQTRVSPNEKRRIR